MPGSERNDHLLKIYLPSNILKYSKAKIVLLNLYGHTKLRKNNIHEIFIEAFSCNAQVSKNSIGILQIGSEVSFKETGKNKLVISIHKNNTLKYSFEFEKNIFQNSNSKCMLFFYEKSNQNTIKNSLNKLVLIDNTCLSEYIENQLIS